MELIHFFHAFSDTSYYRLGALDAYDTVLMVGDHEIEYLRRVEQKRKLKKKSLISVGLPYFDELIISSGACEVDKSIGSAEQQCVLLAPSWGHKNFLKNSGIFILITSCGAPRDQISSSSCFFCQWIDQKIVILVVHLVRE